MYMNVDEYIQTKMENSYIIKNVVEYVPLILYMFNIVYTYIIIKINL